MIADTELSRTNLSTLYAVGTGLSAVTVFITSRMADRYGPKIVIIIAINCLTLTCFGMAFAAGSISFFITFAVLRALGQGSLSINATLVTAQWFVTKRGKAMAIMGLGFAASMAFIPILSQNLIDKFGWRETYAILGIFVWILVVPSVLLFLRNTPEEMGLYPDGYDKPPISELSLPESNAQDKRKILSSVMFWGLAIPLCSSPFISTALVFHQVAIFTEKGFSSGMAAAIFVPLSISAILSSIIAGIISDKTGPKKLFYVSMVILLLAMTMLQVLESPFMAVIYSIILGASNGTGRIVSSVIWADIYGRHKLGRVQGSATMVMITASALGPLPLAITRSVTGNFTSGILIMCIIPIISIAIISIAKTNEISPVNKKSQ
jgi:MFS family permease